MRLLNVRCLYSRSAPDMARTGLHHGWVGGALHLTTYTGAPESPWAGRLRHREMPPFGRIRFLPPLGVRRGQVVNCVYNIWKRNVLSSLRQSWGAGTYVLIGNGDGLVGGVSRRRRYRLLYIRNDRRRR